MEYHIAELPVAGGTLGLGPMPGRTGNLEPDLATLALWRPDHILTLLHQHESARKGVPDLAQKLQSLGATWQPFTIPDFGTPNKAARAEWPPLSHQLLSALGDGQRLFVHCMGGCGRSGMISLRLMVEAGEDPDAALMRLRAVRPCAVETKAQHRWAIGA